MRVRGKHTGRAGYAYPDVIREGRWWVDFDNGYIESLGSKEALLHSFDVVQEVTSVDWEKYAPALPVVPNDGRTFKMKPVFPNTAKDREDIPLAEGLFYYFPNALAKVAQVSVAGNKQHNLGPLHWDRSVSTNHADKILRHQVDAGTMDSDNMPHSAKVAWRALAQLEDELIAAGATPGRNARNSPGDNKEGESIERDKYTVSDATQYPVVKSRLSCCEEDVLPKAERE